MTGRDRGNDLGVGGDRCGNPQLVLHTQVAVVVDVAVECGDDVRRVRAALLFRLRRVERVGVRLTDDADTRPAGVTEQRCAGMWRRHCTAEERVVGQRLAERCGVVPEFTNLCRLLVDEGEHRVAFGITGRDDGAVLEERVVAAFVDERSERLGVDVVIPHVEVDARRIPTADLEPINRGKRLLRDEVCRHCSSGRVAAGEGCDLSSCAEPIIANGPQHVGQADEFGVRRFEPFARQSRLVRVELGFTFRSKRIESIEALGQCADELGLAAQGEDPRETTQRRVDLLRRRCHFPHVRNRLDGRVEPTEQIFCSRNRSRGWSADDADDAAHSQPRYRLLPLRIGQPGNADHDNGVVFTDAESRVLTDSGAQRRRPRLQLSRSRQIVMVVVGRGSG